LSIAIGFLFSSPNGRLHSPFYTLFGSCGGEPFCSPLCSPDSCAASDSFSQPNISSIFVFLCSSVLPESGVNLCCALSTARELLIRSTLKLQQSMTLIQKRAQGIEGFRWGTLQKGRKIAKCCRNVDLQSARFAAVQQVCGGYTQLDGTLNPYGYW
jgi:hypothetical protein